MNKVVLNQISSFLFFTIVQIVLFLNFNIYEYGFAFIYIGFILFFPLNTPILVLLGLAFTQGLIVDLFYNSIGVNAFALVLIAYIKPTLFKLFIPRIMDDVTDLKSIEQIELPRAVVLMLIFTFIHHLVLFSFINGFDYTPSNLLKTVLSAIISTVILLTAKKLFFKNL